MRALSVATLISAALLNATTVERAWGGPPSFPSPAAVESGAAIDAISALVGDWEGESTFSSGVHTNSATVYLQVVRPQLDDFLILIPYKDSYLGDFGIITYSLTNKSYEIFFPGYRPRTGEVTTSRTFSMNVCGQVCLTWREPSSTSKWETFEISLSGGRLILRRTHSDDAGNVSGQEAAQLRPAATSIWAAPTPESNW